MRQLRLFTLTVCGLLCAAALARAHDMAFPGPPPGGMAGALPPEAMMAGMYPGMQPVYAGAAYGAPPYAGPDYSAAPAYGPAGGPMAPGYGGRGYGGPFGPGAAEEGAEGPGSSDEPGCPLWSVTTEAALLRRTRARQEILIRSGSFTLAGVPLLTTEGLNFDYELGQRFTALLHVNPEFDYEATFIRADDWNATGVVVSSGNISVSAPNILGDAFNSARFDYQSEFWSGELNARWRMMPRLTLLAGVRFMELDDRFAQSDNFIDPATFGTSYTIAVRNQLIGGQVGANYSVAVMGPVCFDTYVKGGYFSNSAEHNMHDIQHRGFGTLEAFNTENTALWEFGFNLTCRFNPYLKGTLGYDALWLNGIASAPGQIRINDLFGAGVTRIGPSGALGVNVEENVRIEGFKAGLELTY